MAFNVMKKAASAPFPPKDAPKDADKTAAAPQYATQKAGGSLAKPSAPKTIVKPKSSGVSFLKRGAERRAMLETEEARSEARKEERGKLWDFWMKPGEERQVTFLDGDIGDDGLIDAPAWYEHEVKIGKDWNQFACTFEDDGWCPLCNRANCGNYAIHALCIVEHTPHEVQNGKNKGSIIQHRRKLYKPKMQTMRKLTAMAVKHGGLTGMTLDIGRSSDEVARVGDTFEIINKAGSYEGALAYMEQAFGVENTLDEETGKYRFELPDYSYEIGYKSADELVALGLGDAPKGPGLGSTKKVDKSALGNQM